MRRRAMRLGRMSTGWLRLLATTILILSGSTIGLRAQAPTADPGLPPRADTLSTDPNPGGPVTTKSDAPSTASMPTPATPDQAASRMAGPVLPHDLSPWAMFRTADRVVKAVMVGLAFASLVTWTVWLAMGVALIGAAVRIRGALRDLREAPHLVEPRSLAIQGGPWQRCRPVAAFVAAARDELARSPDLPTEGVRDRTAMALSRIEARAARSMTRGTGVIATIGSTAPFVGLFGTVWGIMNSFVGISRAHTSNLAVVAPGIAEALLATAVGLVAAIPAVVIYNTFARSIANYRALLGDASAEVLRHLSRDLDRRDLDNRPAHRAAE